MTLRVLQTESGPQTTSLRPSHHLKQLADGLVERGIEVHTCILSGEEHAFEDGQGQDSNTRHWIPRRWQLDPACYWQTVKLIKRLRPHIVHTHDSIAHLIGLRAAIACRTTDRVASVYAPLRTDSWLHNSLQRYFARSIDQLVTNCKSTHDHCIAQGADPSLCTIIPTSIEPSRIVLNNESPTAIRRELGLPDDARIAFSPSPLESEYRLKDRVWAADLLKVVRGDVHLLIAGEGPHRWRIERFRRQVEIRDRVHLLGERSDLTRLLALCDVCWFAHAKPGLSHVVMEAMALGKPVIASDAGGHRDLLTHGQTGYLVAVGDRAGYAKLTRPLLDRPDLAQKIGRAAQERVQQGFTTDTMVAGHVELYRGLKSGLSHHADPDAS